MGKPTLYIFSGLPASGKSTLAKELAKRTSATFLRVDTLEQGLRDVCGFENIEGDGYRLSYLLAKDNLNSGNDVIADSVNPWELTRNEWTSVATSVNANFVNIEVTCSNRQEHRERVENRKVEIENLELPTWKQVLSRDYQEWKEPRISIDTSGKTIKESVDELLSALAL